VFGLCNAFAAVAVAVGAGHCRVGQHGVDLFVILELLPIEEIAPVQWLSGPAFRLGLWRVADRSTTWRGIGAPAAGGGAASTQELCPLDADHLLIELDDLSIQLTASRKRQKLIRQP
jgi:hypothetical protein